MINQELHADEGALFKQIALGDEEAFETLFRGFLPRLTPFALRLTGNEEVAREIVQEAFMHLWLGRDKLEDVKNPAGWIFTVTARLCYKFLRRKVLEEAPRPGLTGEEASHDQYAFRELKTLIHQAVQNLSGQRKTIFLLSREEGLSIPEIASQLNLSSSTVKNTLVSALKQIREHLRAHGYLMPCVLFLWL